MEFVFVGLISLVPGVLWVWFFRRYDSHRPEPIRLLVFVFLLGMLVVVPSARIEIPFLRLVEPPANALVQLIGSVLVVGLVEELAKLVVVYLVVAHRHEFDEVIDGIIYMVTAALGFAAAENLLYMLSYGWEIGPMRAVVSSLAHVVFSGLLGFQWGKIRLGLAAPSSLLTSLLIISFLHGVYNFILLNSHIPSVLSLVLVAVLVWYLLHRIGQAHQLH